MHGRAKIICLGRVIMVPVDEISMYLISLACLANFIASLTIGG